LPSIEIAVIDGVARFPFPASAALRFVQEFEHRRSNIRTRDSVDFKTRVTARHACLTKLVDLMAHERGIALAYSDATFLVPSTWKVSAAVRV